MEELELTYLAKYLPRNLGESPLREVLDIYFPSTAKHPVLRLRKIGEKHELTKKEPIQAGDSSHQMETTIPLTEEEYKEIAQLEGKRLRKIRYDYRNGSGAVFEFNIFKDDLGGLVTIEVEFNSIKEKDEFNPPDFCLADVTQEDFVAGGMLCEKQYEDIEPKLNQFGYEKIVT